MICKNCGDVMPDKVVVTEKVVQIERDDLYYYLRMVRWGTLAVIALILSMCSYYLMEEWTVQKTIQEPSLKLKITKYDGTGRVVEEASRDGAK